MKTVKKNKLLCAVLLLFFTASVTILSTAAFDQDDIMKEMPNGFSDFLNAVPEEIAELLPDGFCFGDASFIKSLSVAADGNYLLKTMASLLSRGLDGSLELIGILTALALMAAMLSSLKNTITSPGMRDAVGLAVGAAISIVSIGLQYGRLEAVRGFFNDLNLIMASLLPLMTALFAMGGNSGGAALNNSTVLLWLELINLFSNSILMPSVSLLNSFAIAGAFLPNLRLSGITSAIRKVLATVLGLSAVMLGSALGAQSLLTASGDRLGMKTAKYFAGNVIPVVGSTVGESLRTVSASVGLLRSTVGVAGIVVIILLLLPTLVSLILTRLAYSTASGVAEMLGVDSGIASLFKEIASVYGFIIAAAALSAVIFIFALTVFALTSSAVGA